MDQGVRGWVVKTAKTNYWRVAGQCDLDDLISDGILFWYRIVNRYPDVTTTKHRMGLFKTAFTNHIHDLSKKRSRLEIVLEADMDVPIDFVLEGEDPSQDPDLSFIISQLPPAIMRVLTRMIERASNPHHAYTDKTRETTNQRACRIAGLDPAKRDVHTAVLQYLRGARLHPKYD